MLNEYAGELLNGADDAYDSGLLDRAADLYAKSASLASAVNNRQTAAYAIARRANCFQRLGRLQEALAVVAPALPGGPDSSGGLATVDALDELALLTLSLPMPLAAIEQSIHDAEQYRRVSRASGKRDGIPFLKAMLARRRGQYEECYRFAQEALGVRQDASPSWSLEAIYFVLIEACTELAWLDHARSFLAQLEAASVRRPNDRRLYALENRRRIALREDDPSSAIRWAREGVVVADYLVQSSLPVFIARERLVQALVAAGEVEQARECLAAIAAMRHAEGLIDRFQFCLLRGDVHLIAAQRAAGVRYGLLEHRLPPPDPALQPGQWRLAWQSDAARRAARAYARSEPLALELDRRLMCDRHRQAVAARRTALTSGVPTA
jgi:tetratricopeptide (TPR) repeat protein